MPQEEYASVHVYWANEGDQLEEQETCLEWEQEGAAPEDLRQSLRYRTTDKVVGVLNVLQNVGVQFVVVEQVRLDLLHTELQVEILEAIFFDLLIDHWVAADQELHSLLGEEVYVFAQVVEYFQDLKWALKLFFLF